jgi:hypothetical protein
MIDVNPKNLLEEIQGAEQFRDAHIEGMADQVERFHGPFYNDNRGEFSPENHYYEYLSLMVPRLVFDNPRVTVSSRRTGTQGDVATAIRHGINRWGRDSRLRELLSRVATDTLFSFGVVLTSQTENEQVSSNRDVVGTSKPVWPTCDRVPQNRFFIDPAAASPQEARFMGHKWVRDKDDLLELAKTETDAGWNAGVIEELAATAAHDELPDRPQDVPDRAEIVAYEIWVPEIELDESPGSTEGFHGTIYTLGVAENSEGEKADFIREPRPYYGPRWGPYTFFGIYTVPNRVFPLSPLAAVEGQIQDLNAQAIASTTSAGQYKKLVMVDSADPTLAQRLRDAPDSYVLPVNGLDRAKFVNAEVGGTTNQQLQYLQVARDRLDRNSGVQEAQRGNVTGEGTATEVQVAAEASSLRVNFIKQQFQDGVIRMLRSVAWFMYYDDRVEFPLGEEAANELGMIDPWLQGGDHDPESGATFDDLELEIEAYSMERTNEGLFQKRAMEAFQLVTQTAEMIPGTPWIKWPKVFELLGDALNFPKLSEMVDMGVAAQAAQAQWGDDQPQNQPMMKGQVGSAGNRGSAKRPTAGKTPQARAPQPGPPQAGPPDPAQLGL